MTILEVLQLIGFRFIFLTMFFGCLRYNLDFRLKRYFGTYHVIFIMISDVNGSKMLFDK